MRRKTSVFIVATAAVCIVCYQLSSLGAPRQALVTRHSTEFGDRVTSDGLCCSRYILPNTGSTSAKLSVLVLLRPGESGTALLLSWSSLRSVREVIVLQWGSCNALRGVPPACEGCATVRLVCAPAEPVQQTARAFNLLAALAQGEVLVRADLRAASPPSHWESLASQVLAGRDTSSYVYDDGVLIVPRPALQQLHGWDERLHGSAADVELLDRVARAGWHRHHSSDDADAAVPAEPGATSASARGTDGSTMVAEWSSSSLLAAQWRLRRAVQWVPAARDGWCEAKRQWSVPGLAGLFQDAQELVPTSLRGEAYEASGRAVPWPALQRISRVDDLRTLVGMYRRIRAGEPVIVVHAQRALPRRLLTLCTARVLAERTRRRPLFVVWAADEELGVDVEDLLDLRDVATDGNASGIVVLRSFWPDLAPSSLFERTDPPGRRPRPVRAPEGSFSLYIRASQPLPLELSPPAHPTELGRCLRELRPSAEVDALARPHAGRRIGVRFERSAPSTKAGERRQQGCSLESFASRLKLALEPPRQDRLSEVGQIARLPPTSAAAMLSMDQWPAQSTLAPVLREADSLATAHRGACGPVAGKPAPGPSKACAQVMVAEWRLLSSSTEIIITAGTAFGELVATTSIGRASVWLGCRGSSWAPYVQPPLLPVSALALNRTPAQRGQDRKGASGPWLEHALLDASSRLAFCFLPKVACTSWRMWLRKLAGHADYLSMSAVHSRASGLQSLADIDAGARASVLQSYRKVVFVRDPWTRLLSAYLNKFVEEPELRRRAWVRELLRPAPAAGRASRELRAEPTANVTFERFVSVLEETARAGRARLMNAHWAAQAEICALHSLRYDFVGQMQHMDEDVARLSARLGFDVELPSGQDYGWVGNRDASRLLPRYYTSRALVARVGSLYRDDLSAPLNGVHFTPKGVFGPAMPKE